jgi:hypothetical protein
VLAARVRRGSKQCGDLDHRIGAATSRPMRMRIYCGGIYDGDRWMTRQSVFDALAALGFTSLEIAH